MGGTKIFVLRMKDIIRIGLLVLAGIVLLVVLLVFLIPRGGGDEEAEYDPTTTLSADAEYEGHEPVKYIAGTYTSSIILNGEPVNIRVTVSDHEILAIEMTDMDETQQTFYPLFEPSLRYLAEQILRYQTARIEPETDNPVTTAILQQAVIAALQMAYAN